MDLESFALFLLCSPQAAQALRPEECAGLLAWLKNRNLSPAALLRQAVPQVLDGFPWGKPPFQALSLSRIQDLLAQSKSAGETLLHWQNKGFWIITLLDDDYPPRLQQTLHTAAPPLLYGCGARQALHGGGLALLASRNAGEQEQALAAAIGAQSALEAVSLISAAVSKLDRAAISAALYHGGQVLGVIAGALANTARFWSRELKDHRLTLLSIFPPDAVLGHQQALHSNPCLYALADAALILYADADSVTLQGGRDALRRGNIPVWIVPHSAAVRLRADGAQELPARSSIVTLLRPQQPSVSPAPTLNATRDEDAFYQLFLQRVHILAQEPMRDDELARAFRLKKHQLKVWLQRAVLEGQLILVQKRPARYQAPLPRANGTTQA